MSIVTGSAGVRILSPSRSPGSVTAVSFGGDVADAVVPPVERDDAELGELLRELLADRPLQHLEAACGVVEQERQAERGELRHQARGRALAVGGEVERAGAQAGQHRDVVAELLGARDVDLDLAAGLLRDQLGELLGGDAARVAGCRAVAERQRGLRDGAAGQQCGRGEQRGGGARQQVTTGRGTDIDQLSLVHGARARPEARRASSLRLGAECAARAAPRLC